MENYNNVMYTQVSYRRNIKDMPFVNKLSDNELALGVIRSLSEIFGEDLEFKTLKNISLEMCNNLYERGFFSKEIIENKDISAYAINEEKSNIIFINEQDHIRIVSKLNGFKLEDCFNNANALDDAILEKLEMCFDINLGYLSANPNLVGTGMEISIGLFLPALTYGEKLETIKKDILRGEFEFYDKNGNVWNGKTPFIILKNLYTFGYKENEIACLIENITNKLIELERLEETNIFNVSASKLIDNIYRTFGELGTCYRISSKEAEEKMGKILWGLNLNALKLKRKINIFEFIYTLGDYHISSKNDGIKEIEKKRAKLINEYIINNIQKGVVDV